MLCRRSSNSKHVVPSNLFKLLLPFLFISPLSTKPTSNSRRIPNHLITISPKPISKKPISKKLTSLAATVPQVSDTVSLSHVSSISSLLACPSHKASSVEDLLKGFKGSLSSKLVLEVLMNYRQLGRVKTLEFFSWAGLQMGFKFDDSVIEYMADFLGRRKLFDDMKCFLMTVKSHNTRISCRAFSTCIRYLGRQGMVSEALCLFEEMGSSQFRCKPDNLVYNNMLYVLCKKNPSEQLINQALDIFRRIESPDTYSYSNVVVGLCSLDRLEMALEVFGKMSNAGLVPTRSAANVLIGRFCSASSKEGGIQKVRIGNTRRPFTILVPNVSDVKSSGAIETAVMVFWAVHDLGLLPSSFVLVQLLTELCRLGKMDESVEILKVVDRSKLTCRDESYTVVINAMCSHRCVEEASRLFRRMLSSSGAKPKLSVYNSVISMLCKIGNLDDAMKVFRIMNKNRCVPDASTYAALIHGCVEAKNWESGYDLLMEMLGCGWRPHFHTYDLVVKLLSQRGKVDLCFKLERRSESQALLKLCKAGRLEEAREKLRSMLDKALYPPRYVKEAFERSFEKYGKLKLAQELLEIVDKAQSKQKEEKSLTK